MGIGRGPDGVGWQVRRVDDAAAANSASVDQERTQFVVSLDREEWGLWRAHVRRQDCLMKVHGWYGRLALAFMLVGGLLTVSHMLQRPLVISQSIRMKCSVWPGSGQRSWRRWTCSPFPAAHSQKQCSSGRCTQCRGGGETSAAHIVNCAYLVMSSCTPCIGHLMNEIAWQGAGPGTSGGSALKRRRCS